MKSVCRPSQFLRLLCLAALVLSPSVTAFSQQTPPAPQPAPTPTPKPLTAKDLIAQGIAQYRKGKFEQAAKQFVAALKLEPNNDEALGYASLTAYELGNLLQARELFGRRANLPNQKSSVKTFSTYMAALTSWRLAHELIAKRGELVVPETVYNLSVKEALEANEHITAGLETIKKVLALKPDYTEAVNVKNLLHAEAAAVATDAAKAEEQRQASLAALRQALQMPKASTGDFGAPTIVVGEFATTDEDQTQMKDPMLALVEGGRPFTRATAVLPVMKIAPARPRSQDGEPPPTGVGPGGSAVSIGPGQGALRPSKTEVVQLKGGLAKVEVLVNAAGKVVFARILDAPPATTGPALEAAKKWTFTPPKFEGQPIQVLGVITFAVKSASKDTKAKTKVASNEKKPN
jgi:hypothetical protein